MYHRLRNHFGRTQLYSKVTWLKWKLDSVYLEIALILTQDWCTVSTEHTKAQKSFWTHPMELLGEVMLYLISVCLETVLVSVQDRCMVCARRTIGLANVLFAPDGTTR